MPLQTFDASVQFSRRHTDKATAVRRVYLAGKLSAFEAPGGGETQMKATAAALRELGVDARTWRPWEDDLADADCLHLFGSEPEHVAVAQAARRRGVPVVLSTIAWFDAAARWREPGPWHRRLAGCAKLWARAALPGMPSWRRRLYHLADALLPNSRAEAEQLVRLFDAPRERIHVVPNGADSRFAHATPDAFIDRYGVKDFILYAGRIEPRKNQLNFLLAMRDVPTPVVVLGATAPGCEGYLKRCRKAAGPRVQFVGHIDHDDPLLASAYAACRCLVLASWFETPGLVALEAGLTGTPLVLTQRGSAQEYFGPQARYVDPADVPGIRRTVSAAIAAPRSAELASLIRRRYSWRAAAESTLAAYAQCRGALR
jgi:glycosyltransferase involved in cell wall biosynthesis